MNLITFETLKFVFATLGVSLILGTCLALMHGCRFKNVWRWSRSERRLRLFRIMWERDGGPGLATLGGREGYDVKLSFAIERKFQDSWVGLFWKSHVCYKRLNNYELWICVIPWFPIRVHYLRSYGGRFS
jgi:hypothetical protein